MGLEISMAALVLEAIVSFLLLVVVDLQMKAVNYQRYHQISSVVP